MPKLKRGRAFTLLELIVVMTIVTILSFTLFNSLVLYTQTTRDTIRISDISTIETSVELNYLSNGEYPNPSNSFPVNYSGSRVWDQGYFGIETISDVAKLFSEPSDPLNGKKYTYSLSANKKQYEIAGIQESINSGVDNNIITNVFAGERIGTAYVLGNYNQKAIKVNSGSLCLVISSPSIIASYNDSQTELKNILDNKKLVYNGYANLPANFIGTSFNVNGGFDFESGKELVYSDNNFCKGLLDKSDNSTRRTLVKNLQTAYSGSIIENSRKIEKLLFVDTESDELLDEYAIDFIDKRLSRK